MGNDDSTTFDGVAHVKIIDVSCPQQMLSIMKWTMAGNRGLTYLRVIGERGRQSYTTCGYELSMGRVMRSG